MWWLQTCHRFEHSSPIVNWFVSVLLLSAACPAGAVTRTWSGGGPNGFWSTGSNWVGNIPPVAGSDLLFPFSKARRTATNDFATNTAFGSITFSSSNYFIYGNPIGLSGGITATNPVGTNQFSPAIQLNANQTITCNSATLLLGGHIDLNGHDLTFAGSGTHLAYFSGIAGAGNVTKTGSGTLRYGALGPNTYTGTTTVNGGTLEVGNGFIGAAVAVPGPLVIGDGVGGANADVVRLLADDQLADTATITINSSGLLDLNGHTDRIGPLALIGGNVTTGQGTLELGDKLVTVGSASVASVSGKINLAATLLTFVIADGPANPDLNIFASISGTDLVKDGPGTLALWAANSFSGQLSVNAGLVSIFDSSSLGTTNGGTVVSAGAALQLNGGTHVGAEALTLAGGGPIGNGALVGNGFASWNGPITLAGDTFIGALPSAVFQLVGGIGGTGNVTKLGDGELEFVGSWNNSYVGVTAVNAGTLLLFKTNGAFAITGDLVVGDGLGGTDADVVGLGASSQWPQSSAITVNSSGLLDLAGTTQAGGPLSGTGDVNLGAGRMAVGVNSISTFNGTIRGTGGSFEKALSGEQILTGTNSYTGQTFIEEGNLHVTGAIPFSPVRVQSLGSTPALLSGSATIGSLTVVGGTVAPGASGKGGGVTGQIQCNAISFDSNSTYRVKLLGQNPGPGGYDQLTTFNPVNLSSPTLDLLVGFPPFFGEQFVIINNQGTTPINGGFKGLPQSSTLTAGGLNFLVSYKGGNGNDVSLTLTDVPLQFARAFVTAGNGNGAIDPNECNDLRIALREPLGLGVSGVEGVLSTTTPGVLIPQAVSAYPNFGAGDTRTNLTPFQIRTFPTVACGTRIDFNLVVSNSGGATFSIPFVMDAGVGAPVRFDYTIHVVVEPNRRTSATLNAPIAGPIGKLVLSLNLGFPSDGALGLRLRAPDGTSCSLSLNNGGNGLDYGVGCADEFRTTFDDEAPTSILNGAAPFQGAFRPQTPLAVFTGKTMPQMALWTLDITNSSSFTGTLNCWSLLLFPRSCEAGSGECVGCPGAFTNSITASSRVQTGMLRQTGAAGACTRANTCPGVIDSLARHYDVYTFANDFGEALCMTVTLQTPCTNAANNIFAAAYAPTFNPTNPCLNYLADIGSSPSPFGSFSFVAPDNSFFQVVVYEVTPNAGCANYTLNTTGLPCRDLRVGINRVPNTNQVKVVWPTTAAGYLLESAPFLSTSPPSAFLPVTNQAVVLSGNYTVTNNTSGSKKVYRLRKP